MFWRARAGALLKVGRWGKPFLCYYKLGEATRSSRSMHYLQQYSRVPQYPGSTSGSAAFPTLLGGTRGVSRPLVVARRLSPVHRTRSALILAVVKCPALVFGHSVRHNVLLRSRRRRLVSASFRPAECHLPAWLRKIENFVT